MNSELTAQNGHAETELHAAAWAGDVKSVNDLIENGIDVNVTDSIRETPLHGAAAWGRTKVVDLLLSSGANPNLKNNDGNTSLHWACSHGNRDIVELLIGSGAELINNGLGQSPLEIAKSNNKQEIISWLKQNIYQVPKLPPPTRTRFQRVRLTMIYLAKNKIYAILVYCIVNGVVYSRGDKEQLELSLWVLAAIMIPILIPRVEAWFASWGLMEGLAKDFGTPVSPNIVSFFYWLMYLVASMFFLFNWSLY